MHPTIAIKLTITLSILVFVKIESLPCRGSCVGVDYYDYYSDYDEVEPPTKDQVAICEDIQWKSNVPYYNGTLYECKPLLEQGPCSSGERIVLDAHLLKDTILKGCARSRSCINNEFATVKS